MEKKGETGLGQLIRRGGVWYHIPGTTPAECLTHIIEALTLPAALSRSLLLEAVLEREALMPTAVGHGIALPHPRNPLIADEAGQFIAAAFPEQPLDWQALDGEPVHTVLLIVSASARFHLHTLSRINFLCQQESFRGLLKNRESPEAIAGALAEAEGTWE
jgi:PTS system nitrogen regulatory IIA component